MTTVTTTLGVTTIFCSKCGATAEGKVGKAGDLFKQLGWVLSPARRKLTHLCPKCNSTKPN